MNLSKIQTMRIIIMTVKMITMMDICHTLRKYSLQMDQQMIQEMIINPYLVCSNSNRIIKELIAVILEISLASMTLGKTLHSRKAVIK